MPGDQYDPLRREYARIASEYDSRWKFYVEASIRETLSRMEVGAGEQVLDVGCGTGALLEALSRDAPQAKLSGVDLSEEMLDMARARLPESVALRQGHAEALPFPEGVFDVVVSSNVFHFIRNPIAALEEMKRVLKPGGRVVITDWCDDYLSCRVCELFLRAFSRGHFRTYGTGACRELLEEVGFVGVDVERYKINWLWGLMTATATSDDDDNL